MDGYKIIALSDIVEQLGEDRVTSILSDFWCPKNKDVESFLKTDAILFSKQGIAQTQLIFTSYKNAPRLIAYFALANKYIAVSPNYGKLSKRFRQRINKFARYDVGLKAYIMSVPLIAQLGKNFKNDLNKLITGDEVLSIACKAVSKTQKVLGGRFVYLECEDKPQLINFYSQNGFVNFGKRLLDRDETEVMQGQYLIQMLKYL